MSGNVGKVLGCWGRSIAGLRPSWATERIPGKPELFKESNLKETNVSISCQHLAFFLNFQSFWCVLEGYFCLPPSAKSFPPVLLIHLTLQQTEGCTHFWAETVGVHKLWVSLPFSVHWTNKLQNEVCQQMENIAQSDPRGNGAKTIHIAKPKWGRIFMKTPLLEVGVSVGLRVNWGHQVDCDKCILQTWLSLQGSPNLRLTSHSFVCTSSSRVIDLSAGLASIYWAPSL